MSIVTCLTLFLFTVFCVSCAQLDDYDLGTSCKCSHHSASFFVRAHFVITERVIFRKHDHSSQYMMKVNIKAAGGMGDHLTEEDPASAVLLCAHVHFKIQVFEIRIF